MRDKIKCRRCKDLTALETSIRNVHSQIVSMKAKGMKTRYLDDGLVMLESKKSDTTVRECACYYAEQVEIPHAVIRG